MGKIDPAAQAASTLGSIDREYTLYEIAIMTRAGPAKSLGLKDRGHLGVGACADVTVYEDIADKEAMFTAPELVFKNGQLIVRNGRIIKLVQGATHVARPAFDKGIERSLRDYFERYHTVRMDNFRVSDDEIIGGDHGSLIIQPTGARAQ
jgi:formylmethanofuran dehydrogenase subunit A